VVNYLRERAFTSGAGIQEKREVDSRERCSSKANQAAAASGAWNGAFFVFCSEPLWKVLVLEVGKAKHRRCVH